MPVHRPAARVPKLEGCVGVGARVGVGVGVAATWVDVLGEAGVEAVVAGGAGVIAAVQPASSKAVASPIARALSRPSRVRRWEDAIVSVARPSSRWLSVLDFCAEVTP
jgi:hypothetical protein